MKRILLSTLFAFICFNAFGQSIISKGKPVTASQTHPSSLTSYVTDCVSSTVWSAGAFAPQFVQIDLQGYYKIDMIKLNPDLSPHCVTQQRILVTEDLKNWNEVDDFSKRTVSGKIIKREYKDLKNVRAIRVQTMKSKSWIAWREIEVFGSTTDIEMNRFLSERAKEEEIEKKNVEEKKRKELALKMEYEENRRKELERINAIKAQIENRTYNGTFTYQYEGFKYTGNFVNGVPNGHGRWEKPDGSWYEGAFENGNENGIGTLRMTNGLRYTGNFTNGVPNGNFKIIRWTLMGLAKDEWSAVYENGKLISSSQTESGMTDLFSGKSSTSSSIVANSNSNRVSTCNWVLVNWETPSSKAKFKDKNGSNTSKTAYCDYKDNEYYYITGGFGETHLGTYYPENGNVYSVGFSRTKIGVASTLDQAVIIILQNEYCK